MKGGRIALIAVVAACVAPSATHAQKAEVTPHLGMHMPVGLLLEGRDQTDNSFVRRRQLGAISIGARFTVLLHERFAIESNTTYSPGLVAITDRDRTVDLGGRVFMGHVKGLFRIAQTESRWSFWAGSGVGLVSRHGDGWDGTGGTTDAALVLAGKARLRRLNSNKAFILAVEDYVTRAAFLNTNASASPRIHHDFVYSFGMSIPLTR
jgi:hypothetical protein